MFIKEIYLSDKARSTIRRTLTRGKKNPGQKRGPAPPPGPPLNPPLFLVGAKTIWYSVKIPKDVYRCCKNYLKIVLPWLWNPSGFQAHKHNWDVWVHLHIFHHCVLHLKNPALASGFLLNPGKNKLFSLSWFIFKKFKIDVEVSIMKNSEWNSCISCCISNQCLES